jgi:hypothetical protein
VSEHIHFDNEAVDEDKGKTFKVMSNLFTWLYFA